MVEGLAGMEGTDGRTASREEIPWAVTRLLEALARRRPLVVVLDDLHWAEPALLDLVEHVVGFARDAPILVIGLARPELLDERPGWGRGGPETTPIALAPLGADECGRLVGNLLGGVGSPNEAIRASPRRRGAIPCLSRSSSPS